MTYARTLVVIRERSFLDLLDLALLVVRDRPIVLGLTALVGIAPFALFNVWLSTASNAWSGLWVLLLLMETPCATAPLTLVLGDLMFGVRPRLAKIVKTLIVSSPALFFTQVWVRGVLLLFCIGCFLVPARFSFVNETLLLERVGPLRALRRSGEISRGFGGDLYLRFIGQIALGAMFAWCFQKGTEQLGSVLAGGELTWDQSADVDVSDILFQAGVWIAIAFFAVVRFLSYIDRRIRLEGWELQLRLKSVGLALEERQT